MNDKPKVGEGGAKDPPFEPTEDGIRTLLRQELSTFECCSKEKEAPKPYAQEKQKLEIARYAAASQWLIASLLAVNLAGLVFSGDNAGLDRESRLATLILFYLGVVLALFAGHFNQQSAKWHMTEAKVDMGGRRPQRKNGSEFQDADIEHEQREFDGMANIAAWSSFGCFVAASMWAGLELAGMIE